ncbi:MAG: leucyl/phenylalanyl-tRNA--protein transferase [Pseudomonadales bacterium]|nr:leucyl/phenylalanyl-tRNA--protein transferase [Pseudomonadales bacterium]NIX08891.1 leucyl/phenylalanyl-tRNA--protein transferase [Pseudomonadales bacterium]
MLSTHQVGFPPAESALAEPNGLLAVGGELTPRWLLAAYARGIFPWFDDDASPVLWWSPDPRAVLIPEELRVTRSLAKRIRNAGFVLTMDRAFADVVAACAEPRSADTGTWITPEMAHAYGELHTMGFAHSVEVWLDGKLVGGLYGVSLGRMFFGESMFARERDASKVALYYLTMNVRDSNFTLIDCQIMNEHLRSLGVREMPRAEFLDLVRRNENEPTRRGSWACEIGG